jgi:hypothetical protein
VLMRVFVFSITCAWAARTEEGGTVADRLPARSLLVPGKIVVMPTHVKGTQR